MKQYLDLLKKVLVEGEERTDRTGTGTYSLFGAQLEFDLRDGFPLLTTKKMPFQTILGELLWMLHGGTNIKELNDQNIHIWDDWADENGDLGPIYGKQWRAWSVGGATGGLAAATVIDQIAQAVEMIKHNPDSRRIIISAWNVGEISSMALPPCHCFFQFYVHTNGVLDLHLYQRSADMFLGVPFDIAEYALLLTMVARLTDKAPGRFIYSLGDCHIYKNHVTQVLTQLKRKPYGLPKLILSNTRKGIDLVNRHGEDFDYYESIDEFKKEDFTLRDYDYYPAIKAPISV